MASRSRLLAAGSFFRFFCVLPRPAGAHAQSGSGVGSDETARSQKPTARSWWRYVI